MCFRDIGFICVQIFIYNNDTGFYQKLTANASDTSIVVANIVKDESYNVCILAYNSVGDGVASYTVVGEFNLNILACWMTSCKHFSC
jgi:hypothetical protein